MEASMKMAQAAEEYLRQPMALKLRELQTLAEIAREKNLIVVTSGGGLGDTVGAVAALQAATDKARRQG
jgi:regulator of protease activity HflC (stomatin/prohibitin superfamily)